MFGASDLRLPELPFCSAARVNPVVISPQWHALLKSAESDHNSRDLFHRTPFPGNSSLYALLQ